MDAEAIRDGMLAVSGELNESRPAGSLVAKEIGDRPISLIGLDPKIPKDLDGSLHRSVYLPVSATRCPMCSTCSISPSRASSPAIGRPRTYRHRRLYLMNGPFVKARAAGLANRIAGEKDPASQVRSAFLLCFSREPDAEELKLGIAFIGGGTKESSKPILTAYCQRYWPRRSSGTWIKVLHPLQLDLKVWFHSQVSHEVEGRTPGL